jgi:hypothetical protein
VAVIDVRAAAPQPVDGAAIAAIAVSSSGSIVAAGGATLANGGHGTNGQGVLWRLAPSGGTDGGFGTGGLVVTPGAEPQLGLWWSSVVVGPGDSVAASGQDGRYASSGWTRNAVVATEVTSTGIGSMRRANPPLNGYFADAVAAQPHLVVVAVGVADPEQRQDLTTMLVAPGSSLSTLPTTTTSSPPPPSPEAPTPPASLDPAQAPTGGVDGDQDPAVTVEAPAPAAASEALAPPTRAPEDLQATAADVLRLLRAGDASAASAILDTLEPEVAAAVRAQVEAVGLHLPPARRRPRLQQTFALVLLLGVFVGHARFRSTAAARHLAPAQRA